MSHQDKTAAPLLMSRRQFLYGSCGAAAAGLAALILSGCAKGEADEGPKAAIVDTEMTGLEDVEPISVSLDSVFTTDQCELLEDLEGTVTLANQVSLPYGSLLWSSDDDVAACLIPGETSSPLAQIGILALDTGSLYTVVEDAVGASEGFQVYDVRGNRNGIVWTEADILAGSWRVYSATLNKGADSISEPSLLEEGDGSWSVPALAVSGRHAFWQTSSTAEEGADAGMKRLMRASIGGSSQDVNTVLEFGGTSLANIVPTENGICCCMLASKEEGTYGIVAINAEDGAVTDQMVLPSPMKPTYASFGSTGFSFAFEGIYENNTGISNLGTYTPANGDPAGEWFHFERTPFEPACWSNGWFLVKSTTVVAGIDTRSRRYFTIEPENATQGYGEYLASEGTSDTFVTFSNIDYTPINSDHLYECNVRIWKPKKI